MSDKLTVDQAEEALNALHAEIKANREDAEQFMKELQRMHQALKTMAEHMVHLNQVVVGIAIGLGVAAGTPEGRA